ncbi:hypothetical protein LMG24235_03482 [Paraburkholderia sabiae]|jgi:hypothetical protein|nr:hypothetical protein LMG24235_03482 [Paraburkholderia sabiae]
MLLAGRHADVALQYRATPATAGKYWDSLGSA